MKHILLFVHRYFENLIFICRKYLFSIFYKQRKIDILFGMEFEFFERENVKNFEYKTFHSILLSCILLFLYIFFIFIKVLLTLSIKLLSGEHFFMKFYLKISKCYKKYSILKLLSCYFYLKNRLMLSHNCFNSSLYFPFTNEKIK